MRTTYFLRNVPVLAGLSEELLERLADQVREVRVPAGSWIMREGDPAQSMFIVRGGRIEVVHEGPPEVLLRVLRRGDVLGELALLREGVRAASARTQRDTELLELGRGEFESLIEHAPEFALGLTRVMGAQIAASRSPVVPAVPPRTIAVVGLDRAAPVDEIAEALAVALDAHESTVRLRSGDMATIDQAERDAGRVVLVAPERPEEEWTRLCLSEADVVLAVTTGALDERWMVHLTVLRDCELLVLGGPLDAGAVDALKPREVQLVAEATGRHAALESTARRFVGRSLGIVLSGGGARALTHLGVLEELRAAGLQFDRFAGASLGSLIAAMAAMGLDSDALYDLCVRGFVESKPTGDFTFPAFSIIRGSTTRRLMHGLFGERRIEELPHRFFCVSCDLIRREAVVHRTGRLMDAVYPSLAIPGVFPPVSDGNGRLLVDGGVLDNLPVSTMARRGEGPVIAVDCTGPVGQFKRAQRPRLARLGRPIRHALTGSEAAIPRLGETIVRTVTVGSIDTVASARLHADLVITPPVEAVGLLDWKAIGRVRELGAEAARQALAADPDLAGRLGARGGVSSTGAGHAMFGRHTDGKADVPGAFLPHRRRPAPRTVLAVAALGSAVAFVDGTIVNIAFPDILRSFPAASTASVSWVLNAYNIVFAAFLLPAGRISDLVGRRRMFILGLELFTAASLLCAVAPSIGALVAFRVVQALGAAMLVPASLALVLNAFPPEHRSHGVALLAAVAAAAAGLGPSLGGLLIAAANWRLVFLVNLPIGIAAIVLARRLTVESRAAGRRRMPDLLGAVIFALAIASLVLAIVKGQEWGWGSPRIVGLFAASILLGGAFAWRCSWHRSPMLDLALLRMRSLSAANGMTVVAAAGYYGYTLTNVLFLTSVWRYSILQAGLALTPGPFVAAAVAGPSSRLVLRVGHRPVLVAGGLIWGTAVLWFVERVGTTPAFVSEWLPGIVLLGVGAGTLFPNLTSASVAAAPKDMFATATGINSVARQVGAALGVALVVAIIGTPSPAQAASAFRDAWIFGSACLYAAGIGCLLVGRVNIAAAPSLGDAARTVLQSSAPEPPEAQPPRARRVMSVIGPALAVRGESAAEFFARVPLFAGLEPALREQLAMRTETLQLAAGRWLFHQGDSGDAMYVVRAGRLEAVDERTGNLLRELGRGDAVGELALLTGAPRAAGVRAVRASDLIAIARDDFDELLRTSPALSLALTRSLAEQLRETGAPPRAARPRPATVAVVRLGPNGRAESIPRQLAAALARYQATELLDGSEVGDAARGQDAASVYGPLLDRAEAANDLVLLDAGTIGSGRPWDEFCLQQADRILAVTSSGDGPRLSGTRTELHGCDLVAVDASPGSGAINGWGEALEPVECHVIRGPSSEDDVARMARRLSGRSVGIVLSGGGARAFAHIGVLEELSAAGVRIDRVAGVSMGAFVGALFAMGLDADEIDACCFDEWVQRRPLSDYTIPRHSLIRGERFGAMLHRTFGTTMIEELPRSFMCGCTELRSGRLVITRHGPLWEAVGFSICLPIIAPPQVRGREMFIDGSLVDNLPVGVMAELGEGPVIAVDVKAGFERKQGGRPDTGPAARPRDLGRTPSIGETLTRVLLLGSANTSEAAGRHADMVITPRADGVGLLEFHQIDAAREAGRAAARETLEQASGSLFAPRGGAITED